jgi:hypothetical protein
MLAAGSPPVHAIPRARALGGGWQDGHAEDARADPLGGRLDGSALAGAVAAFEDGTTAACQYR